MKTTPAPLIAALLIVLFWSPSTTALGKQPNVVLIMADDLGYHDLGCYGHPDIKTPVLDGLAKDGIRLTSFYAGATVCTPSRMALLTGAYPARLGWTKGVVGHIMKKGTGLAPEADTIAEVFKQSGYRTGMFGKWHLGDEPPLRPHRQGFDENCYINKSNNQTDALWRDDELLERPFENRRLTETFTREAIRFIKDRGNQPFFLYLPYSAPHFPLEAHPDWKGNSTFGVYGDVVEEMDHRIGEIVATLKSEKIDEQTVVVFLSDNGPEPMTKESKALPFRGKKWDALEGGTRVPCIARWPGRIPKGQESDALIAAIDLLPTLCHACGITLEAPAGLTQKIDGVNVWPTLIGTPNAQHPREDLLYWHGSDGFQAIRVGDWKLYPTGEGTKTRPTEDRPALFNLTDDIAESKNLSSEFPDKVRSMSSRADQLLSDIRGNALPLGE